MTPSRRSRPLHVAIVAPTLGILGGQAVQADRLLDAWRGDPDVRAWLVPINPVPPAPFARATELRYLRTVVTQACYWPSLLRELRHADVVHVFSASYTSFLLAPLPAVLVAKLLGKPVVLNYRSGEAPDHLRRSPVARAALRWVERNAVPSDFLKNVFAGHGIAADVIPNIVDVERFGYRERRPLRPRIVSTRNFEALYNVSCTLRAFRLVQDVYPEASLTLVGAGSLDAQLRAEAAAMGLNHVDFAGRVPPAEMWRYYDGADIYLQTPDIDNMPSSVLEASASGCVVVSTNAGGVPAILTHDTHGLLVPCGDAHRAADAVLRALGDPALASRLTANARARCEQYRWKTVRAQWLALYDDVAVGRQPLREPCHNRDMTHALRRILAMPRRELRFRLESRLRNAGNRVRVAALRPRWDRQRLLRELRPDVSGSPEWAAGCRSLASNDHESAHRAFAVHFSRRASVLPLNARELPAVVATINERYPDAAAEATRRADGICAGRYDLLGFRGLQAGPIPDWHRDPVTGRPAPRAFWASVPYLDPACGDHKVTWELNRHQHWLALGRAHALTGDGRFSVHFSNQLASWMAANPPLVGTNWASMLELGFRVITWLWSLEVFATPARHHGNPPWIVDMLLAIDRQLAHVEQNLSRYFSPNTHLTGEALALYVGGQALPELQASPRRAALGREILLQEAERQINDDGGHAELSPHYHRYSTDFYLFAAAVARRAGDWAAGAFEDAARRQSRYLRTIADDAGRRPAIGDDDGGQLFPVCGRDAADCRDTLAVAAVLLNEPGLAVGGIPEEAFWVCGMSAAVPVSAIVPSWTSSALRSSGYFVSRTAQGDHLVVDAGRHGFLNGGHAHADALACVLTIKGQPLLVDPGTATYTMDPVLRDRFRGTSMHNTIVVDGRPQSMPAGPFHWQSRAAARVGMWRSSETCDYVEASHDGYLPRRHVRSVLAMHGVGWWIVDRVLGPEPAAIECYWHLHPQWHAALRDAHVALLQAGGRMTALASTAPLSLLAPGEHPLAAFSPGYGIVEPAPVLVGRLSTPLPAAIATFIPADAVAADDLEIAAIQLTTLPVAGFVGAAFRARWRGGATAIVAALEETGVAADEMAAPRNLWGTAQVRTDARVAATIERADGSADIIAVNGATTETHPGGRLLAVPERVPLVRSAAVAPSMARRTPRVNQREYMPCAE